MIQNGQNGKFLVCPVSRMLKTPSERREIYAYFFLNILENSVRAYLVFFLQHGAALGSGSGCKLSKGSVSRKKKIKTYTLKLSLRNTVIVLH
jgi:hypothetical protein